MRPLSFLWQRFPACDHSLSPFPRAHGNHRDALFLRGTKPAIGAKRTVESGLWLENSIGYPARGLFDAHARLLQLPFVARRGDRNIFLQIVKGESLHAVIPLSLCGHGIDGKLQTLVGILLISRPARLVVDHSHAAVGATVDAIDASGNHGFAHANI